MIKQKIKQAIKDGKKLNEVRIQNERFEIEKAAKEKELMLNEEEEILKLKIKEIIDQIPEKIKYAVSHGFDSVDIYYLGYSHDKLKNEQIEKALVEQLKKLNLNSYIRTESIFEWLTYENGTYDHFNHRFLAIKIPE